MSRKILKTWQLATLTVALLCGSIAYAGGCFGGFCKRCPAPCPVPAPVCCAVNYGVFNTRFLDGHCGWAYGYVTGNGYIYVINEVRKPDLSPICPKEPVVDVVVDDVESWFKELENWITGKRHEHRVRMGIEK